MKKIPIQVYLDERDRRLLDELAGQHGLTMAEAVRVAIRRWAVEASQAADPVLGLIGSIEADMPTDLSTRHDEHAVYGSGSGVVRGVAERRHAE